MFGNKCVINMNKNSSDFNFSGEFLLIIIKKTHRKKVCKNAVNYGKI